MTSIPMYLDQSGVLHVRQVRIAPDRQGRPQWSSHHDAQNPTDPDWRPLPTGDRVERDGVRLGGLPDAIVVGGAGAVVLVTKLHGLDDTIVSDPPMESLSGTELDAVVIHLAHATPVDASALSFVLSAWRRMRVISTTTDVVLVGAADQVFTRRRLAAWGVRHLEPTTAIGTDHSRAAVTALGSAHQVTPAQCTVVLGPASSGKSAHAEDLLAAERSVCYLAGQAGDPSDGDWVARVERHRQRRPHWWETVEDNRPEAIAALLSTPGPALLWDSVGGWLVALLDQLQAWDRPGAAWEHEYETAVRTVLTAWHRPARRIVAVSEETGWGVIPATPSGRLFRERLAEVNRRLVETATCHLVVAGRVSELERW